MSSGLSAIMAAVRRALLAAFACAALLLAPAASAHIDPFGTLFATGRSSLELQVHNDREEAMTGLRATLPEGFVIVETPPVDGWEVFASGSRADWTGSLGGGTDQSFRLEVEGSAEPGPVVIAVEQLYPGGEVVPWRVPFTAIPNDTTTTPAMADDDSGNRNLLVVGVLGLLAAIAIVAIVRGSKREQQSKQSD